MGSGLNVCKVWSILTVTVLAVVVSGFVVPAVTVVDWWEVEVDEAGAIPFSLAISLVSSFTDFWLFASSI